jgi:hypothetical protein
LDSVLEKNHLFTVRVVNNKKELIKNVNVQIWKIEKEPITLEQWGENLKNGTPFKRLILSSNTDNNGVVTADLVEGFYEAKVEKYGLSTVCELRQNDEAVFIEPKKRWW